MDILVLCFVQSFHKVKKHIIFGILIREVLTFYKNLKIYVKYNKIKKA